MDGEGARALSWRIEQQEHWRQAGAVLDGRQPPIDPDRDSLESVGEGIRLYRARTTRHGMVQLRKHLVDGLWELEMIDVAVVADEAPLEPETTPVYGGAQIYDLGAFGGSTVSAPYPEVPDVYEPPAVPEPYEPPAIATPDRYVEAPAAFAPSFPFSNAPDPYAETADPYAESPDPYESARGTTAPDPGTPVPDYLAEPYVEAPAAFAPSLPADGLSPGTSREEVSRDGATGSAVPETVLPAWGREHSQGSYGSGPNSDELAAVVDELAAVADQLAPFPDELAAVVDELAAVADQLAPFPDELAGVVDELAGVPEEYASVPDELAAVVKELAAVQEELAAVQEELSAVPRILPVLPTELDIAQYDLTSVRRELAAVRDELAIPRTRADDDSPKISRVA